MKKYFYWMVLGIFLLSALVAFLLVRTAPDCGLAEVRSVSDVMGKTVRIYWAEGDPVNVGPDEPAPPKIDYAAQIREYTASTVEQAKEEIIQAVKASASAPVETQEARREIDFEKLKKNF